MRIMRYRFVLCSKQALGKLYPSIRQVYSKLMSLHRACLSLGNGERKASERARNLEVKIAIA